MIRDLIFFLPVNRARDPLCTTLFVREFVQFVGEKFLRFSCQVKKEANRQISKKIEGTLTINTLLISEAARGW